MRYLLIILSFCISVLAFSQQEAQYSNYQMNNFMLNPAVAGTYTFWNIKMGYRTQWVSMPGGPKTMFTTFHGPVHHPDATKRVRRKMAHHGIGGSIYSDRAGAIQYNGVNGTYSFHIILNRELTLSVGASLGVKEFRLDGSQLEFVQTVDDPKITNSTYSTFKPDGNLGFWLYNRERMFFGASARQVLNRKIDFQSGNAVIGNDDSRMNIHYFITSGYLFDISRKLSFISSLMVQFNYPAPVQVDLNGTFWFDKQIGIGLSYRHLDALYLIFDYLYKDRWEFGYAFDYTLSELTRYNSGTHEIIVGLRLGEPRKTPQCPAKFW